MLSESATVAPLRPVPVGVASSLFVCEDERGMLRNDRFFLGSPSVAETLSPCVDLEAVLRRSSVDGGPRDDDRGGGIMALELGEALGCRAAVGAPLA
jgi:hypothetical protein